MKVEESIVTNNLIINNVIHTKDTINNGILYKNTSNFGRNLLEKMGWTRGKGLGKNEQGMASYIKVNKNIGDTGIGKEKEMQEVQWWYDAYDRTAKTIISNQRNNKKTKKIGKKSKTKKGIKEKKVKKIKKEKIKELKKSHVIPTDEELFAATGGKLFGRRAYGSCKGKLKRNEKQIKSFSKEENVKKEELTSEKKKLD